MREAAQVQGLVKVIGLRINTAQAELVRTRDALAPLERRHASAQRSVHTEVVRLQAIREHIATPQVSSSAALYADASASRELASRDLSREQFVERKSSEALRKARQAHERAQAELARLHTRADALEERLQALARQSRTRIDHDEERETEEFASTRFTSVGCTHG